MRAIIALGATLLALAPLAAAQENDAVDPTVSDADFDTSVPPADDAYLAQAEAEAAEPAKTPGVELAVVLGTSAVVAAIIHDRRR
jgi:hypothetical protein